MFSVIQNKKSTSLNILTKYSFDILIFKVAYIIIYQW